MIVFIVVGLTDYAPSDVVAVFDHFPNLAEINEVLRLDYAGSGLYEDIDKYDDYEILEYSVIT